ncbi:MAG: hypothetical protein IJU36_01005 [Paludibacteraceae bacterium]|nr:hypothetical protein [Paludibacteraceae bacterium]
MPPPDKNSTFDSWDALRRDRDRWAQLAINQAEYIRQLEQQVVNYQQQLNMQQEQIKHIGYNVEQMTINMSGGTLVQHADLVQASGDVLVKQPSSLPPDTQDNVGDIPPDFFCISARFTEDNIRERLAAELSQATSKIDYCRALYRLQHIGCINISQYASDAQRAIVLNRFQSKFSLSASDFCKARLNK